MQVAPMPCCNEPAHDDDGNLNPRCAWDASTGTCRACGADGEPYHCESPACNGCTDPPARFCDGCQGAYEMGRVRAARSNADWRDDAGELHRALDMGDDVPVLDRLVGHIEYLEQDSDESDATRERMAALLTGVANAFKGEPKELHLHDWSDLPALAAHMVRDLKLMRGRGLDLGARIIDLLPKQMQPDESSHIRCLIEAIGAAVEARIEEQERGVR